MTRNPRIYYGWVIVAVTLVSMTLIYGTRHSFSVFFPPILDEFGWSRGATVIMFSLNIFVYGLLAPFAGTIGSRWKPGILMPAGALILGLATAGCALATELWHFYVLFGMVMPLGMAFSGWPLLAPAMANWFPTKRGLTMGLAASGAGLSYTVGTLAELIILKTDWRMAFLVMGGIVILLVMTLYLFFFRYHPALMGLKPYGATTGPKEDTPKTETAIPGEWALGQIMRTYHLWGLVLAHMFYFGFTTYMLTAHQVKYAEDAGYSSIFAAGVLGLFGTVKIGGALSGGLSDWMGREKTQGLTVLLSFGALVALLSVKDTSQPWLLYLYAIFFGYGAGLWSPTVYAAAADLFYGRHYGTVVGLMLFGQGAGAAIGPWLAGYLFDTTGSYSIAFIIALVSLVLALLCFWIAAPRHAARLKARI